MIIVAGIGTEIGKTIISAILCQALERDYWKPIQAGELENSDSHKLKNLVSHDGFKTYPEAYRLTEPMSPHAAANRDDTAISLVKTITDKPDNQNVIVELAGGLLVPLSPALLNLDLVKELKAPVVLVANYYLGSINHTLLSIELLKQHDIPTLGLIFNGTPNPDSRDAIQSFGQMEILADIPQAENLDRKFIREQAEHLRGHPKLAEL